jgi:hypothetical protein
VHAGGVRNTNVEVSGLKTGQGSAYRRSLISAFSSMEAFTILEILEAELCHAFLLQAFIGSCCIIFDKHCRSVKECKRCKSEQSIACFAFIAFSGAIRSHPEPTETRHFCPGWLTDWPIGYWLLRNLHACWTCTGLDGLDQQVGSQRDLPRCSLLQPGDSRRQGTAAKLNDHCISIKIIILFLLAWHMHSICHGVVV